MLSPRTDQDNEKTATPEEDRMTEEKARILLRAYGPEALETAANRCIAELIGPAEIAEEIEECERWDGGW